MDGDGALAAGLQVTCDAMNSALPEARERLAVPGMQPAASKPVEFAVHLTSGIAK
jgi:hypothetical protein